MSTTFFRALLVGSLAFFWSHRCPAQEKENLASVTELRGKVVDSRGKPIEKFSVKIGIHDFSRAGPDKPLKKLDMWEGEFEGGEFSFDVDRQYRVNDQVYIYHTVDAEGFVTLGNGGYQLLKDFNGTFETKKLSRTIKLKGRVVVPQQVAVSQARDDQAKISDGKLYIARHIGGLMPDYNKSFNTRIELSEDGTFETVVPENCKIIITACAANAAGIQKTFKIPKSPEGDSAKKEHDLGDIKLDPGVAVSGTVFDHDGKPVAGQIIQIRQNVGKLNFVQNHVYGYAISDKEGNFELPPRIGECVVRLSDTGVIEQKEVKVRGKLMSAKSMSLTLKQGQPVSDIEIREAASFKIHGVINYEGDKPQINVCFESEIYDEVELDEGRFEFEVPEDTSPYIVIYRYGTSEFSLASLNGESLKNFARYFKGSPEVDAQRFEFKKVHSDIGPLEFTMVQRRQDNRSMFERLSDWYYFGE